MSPDAPPDAWIAPLRGLLRDRLGHEVPEARARGELAAFAIARARAVGADGPAAWVDLVGGPRGGEEWHRLVRAATVGETYFFRHPEQLRAIAGFARELAARRGRPLAVWSAGCATGEEAYSLAILLAEGGIAAEVVGTDVNDEALARARAASGYSDRSAGHLPADLRARWLAPDGSRWRIPRVGELRVSFAPHNVARDAAPRAPTPDGRFDLVVCRNVLLYFPEAVVRDVVARLLSVVAPDGALWLGPADLVPADLLLPHRDVADGERFLRPAGARPSPRPPAAVRAPRGRAPAPPPAVEPDVAAWLEQGLVATAEEALERRASRAPRDAEALVALAAIALARHDFERALACLDRVGAAGPRPPGLAYVRGLALARTGRTAEATAAFLDALEDDPDDWAASVHLALHYRRSGRQLQEEVMLEHAHLRLDEEPLRIPDHGVAARLLDSVHRDPTAARRAVAARLAELEAADRPGPA